MAAPFAGVVTVNVSADDVVEAGQTIATIEAMKMEAAITAPKAGTVARVAVAATAQVEGGDLLVVVGPAGRSEATGGSREERSDRGINLTRIVGGQFGGRRIAVPQSGSGRRSGTGTRPTTDRVRESLFNVLDARMELAGRRGARSLRRIGRARASKRCRAGRRRRRSWSRTGARPPSSRPTSPRWESRARRCAAASVAAVLAGGADRPADLVFADPPYEVPAADVEAVLAALADRGWVADGAIAVVERAASGPTLAWPAGWTPGRDRRYGDTRLEFGDFGASSTGART